MRQRFTADEFFLHSQPRWFVPTRRSAAARARDAALDLLGRTSAGAPGRALHAGMRHLRDLAAALALCWHEVVRPAVHRQRQLGALDRLDASALRDLGLDRSELRSVVHELQHIAPTTRRRVVDGTGHPPLFAEDDRPVWMDESLRY